MDLLRVSELNIYPIKSCAQVSLKNSIIDRFGLKGDRRWMIVDQKNGAITQRSHPLMAKITATAEHKEDGDILTLGLDGKSFQISCDQFTKHTDSNQVTLWDDVCDSLVAPQEINHQLSQFLNTSCSLVFMADDCQRLVDPDFAGNAETVSFADGFPILLTTEASLHQFNQWLGETIGMNRFRPNLVLTGSLPFAEDEWKTIRIGEIEFDVAKPCARCVVPSIDPQTLEHNPKVLKTLAKYRQRGKGVLFGQNLIPKSFGKIDVGAVVEILN